MEKKTSCPYCGNNPTPHFFNWYYESLNILLTPARQAVLYNPLSLALGRGLSRLRLGEKLLSAGLALGALRFNTDRAACHAPRAQVLWEEAERRGIAFSELLLFGKGIDAYRAEKDGAVLLFSGLPRPEGGFDRSVLDTLDDKWLLKRRLLAAGLPVAAGGSASSFRQAQKIFRNIRKPVIVKPRAGSRGRHSITYVRTEAQLEEAFAIAKQLCHWVMVEEHLPGPVYRATLIEGRLRGVLRGDSPQVTGDGRRTVRELAEMKNRMPHPGVRDIALGAEAAAFLARQDLRFDSVPPKGQAVFLSEKIGVNYGGSSSEDFDICHEDNQELFVRAAQAIGDPVVGFDFIIPDIARSWKEQRCGFLEANSLPFINLHHDPLFGAPRNVAQYVWEMIGM